MKRTLFTLLIVPALAMGGLTNAAQEYNANQLNLGLMTTGWGKAAANKSASGKKLTMGGKEYQGIGTHVDSKMTVAVDGNAEKFTALVGIDDNAGGNGSVQFKVIGDGKVLFESGDINTGDEPKTVDVSLQGVKTVTLEALAGSGGKNYGHANWADAKFIMKDGKPVSIPDGKLIEVGTDDIDLALMVNKDDFLFQQYIGPKNGMDAVFARGEVKNLAYPTIMSRGDFQFWNEPALHVIHSDGHQITNLKYSDSKSKDIDADTKLTCITLKDPNYEFYVDMYYKSHKKLNVIEQWSVIRNKEQGPVQLLNFASAAFTLNSGDFWLTQFTGGWANEFRMQEGKLLPGSKVLDNKWGITSSNERQQHFMLSIDGKATETEGKVLAATLAWSGNWKMQFELGTGSELNITAGMNPWASTYTLNSGEQLATPALVYTYSNQGKGEATRRLHRWGRAHGMRDGNTLLRTVFNNWEATGMDTSDKRIVPFFKPAKELGFELFLLDDGWFGDVDKGGMGRILGDWQPSVKRHPNGMSVLIKEAGKAGIDFGLWVEMEMANPESHIITEHPEWLLHEPDRPRHIQRHQYVLDLSNPEVQKFCIDAFNKIIKDNPGITFVKWDCNSPFHNPYSHYLGTNQQHLWINYTLGLYKIFDATVKANPKLQMMLCSAGGGRNDYGSLKYFHEFWTSDNTTPTSRVYIQWGTSHIFPAKAMGSHVTHMGRQPFKFGFDVAMSGTLGMDADPTKMTDEEKKVTKRAVEAYKTKLRPVVQLGDLYRLVSPYETDGKRASLMYAAPNKTQAAVFVWQLNDQNEGLTVKLQGLDPVKKYRIEELNIDGPDKAACQQNGQTISGSDLMDKGLTFDCKKKFDSSVLFLKS